MQFNFFIRVRFPTPFLITFHYDVDYLITQDIVDNLKNTNVSNKPVPAPRKTSFLQWKEPSSSPAKSHHKPPPTTAEKEKWEILKSFFNCAFVLIECFCARLSSSLSVLLSILCECFKAACPVWFSILFVCIRSTIVLVTSNWNSKKILINEYMRVCRNSQTKLNSFH